MCIFCNHELYLRNHEGCKLCNYVFDYLAVIIISSIYLFYAGFFMSFFIKLQYTKLNYMIPNFYMEISQILDVPFIYLCCSSTLITTYCLCDCYDYDYNSIVIHPLHLKFHASSLTFILFFVSRFVLVIWADSQTP